VRVAFCVSGRGALARAAIAAAPRLGITPVLLVSDTTAAGDLAGVAAAAGVAHAQLAGRRDAVEGQLAEALAGVDPDLIVLTFDRILAAALVDRYAGQIINVHPALLPAFAGTHAMDRTLASGSRFGGATIHEVTAEVDAGPIVAQAVLATIDGESAEAYGRRLYGLLEPMFLQVLRWYATGRVGHDTAGRVVVRGARYGELPINPALE
jgi:phosphoribosylglycinamide formyltransferase-1